MYATYSSAIAFSGAGGVDSTQFPEFHLPLMAQARRDVPLLQFGDFTVNPRARSIHKHGVRLKLHGQPFEILLLLLERPGEVVTREELQAKLWPANTFVDFEHGVNTAVKKLRRTLGDSADEQRFIETVPRAGYRFIPPVDVAAPPLNAAISVPQILAENSGGTTSVDHTRQNWALRFWPILVGISIVLIVSAGAYLLRSRSPNRPQPPAGHVMLAVLPFENLTGDASQDYFSDGLTEEMIAQLGQLNPQRLGVIGRASVMHYRDSQKSLQEIAHDLGIQYVLEGSVRRDSEKVRITAQLIRVSDQKTVWSRQYNRELTSLLALQEEIAQEIADEIQLALGDSPKRITPAPGPAASPTSYEAYDLYLKGRYFLNKRNAQGFQQAIDYFQQAIAKDPRYALAYAGLADSYALTRSYNLDPDENLMPRARAAALRALQINENLAEAHTSLALIAENYDWDWQTAGKEFRRAIELDPNYPTAHHWYAEYLAWQGRFDEAFAESERARQLDPLSLIISTDRAAILYYSRQYDRAIEQLHAVLDMESTFPRAHGILILAYVQKGQFAQALADTERVRRNDDSPGVWALQAYVYGRAGQQVQARRALAKFEQLNRHGRVDPPILLALAYAGMGDQEKLFNCLQEAFVERSNSLTALKVDPLYDPFRTDPRFQALLRRVGLAQ
jgi:TolB-like protein/DNA-binding winged helix-turn-helix (wHTH) protein/Tfp pilus assembly protein PilF